MATGADTETAKKDQSREPLFLCCLLTMFSWSSNLPWKAFFTTLGTCIVSFKEQCSCTPRSPCPRTLPKGLLFTVNVLNWFDFLKCNIWHLFLPKHVALGVIQKLLSLRSCFVTFYLIPYIHCKFCHNAIFAFLRNLALQIMVLSKQLCW